MDILLLLSPFNILDSEIIKITSVSDLSLEIELAKGDVNYGLIKASMKESTDNQCLLETGVSTCVISGLTPHTLYTVEVSGCDDNICTHLTDSIHQTKWYVDYLLIYFHCYNTT